jgi:hypothetical protein
LGLSACGVPIDSAAHPIPNNPVNVPQALPGSSGGTLTMVTLYFIKNNKLVAVHRPVNTYASIQTTARVILSELDNGPLADEGHGLITLLNPGLSCTYNSQNRIITVALDSEFLDTLFGPSLYDAYGQIVLTLMRNTALSSVQGVQFSNGGQLTYAYLPTETATEAPVTASSYTSLIARS